MKRHSIHLLLTGAIALSVGVSLPFLVGNQHFDPERDSVKSEVPSLVAPPSVPSQIEFAGQVIDLKR